MLINSLFRCSLQLRHIRISLGRKHRYGFRVYGMAVREEERFKVTKQTHALGNRVAMVGDPMGSDKCS